MDIVLIVVQIVLIAAIGIMIWQVWKFLHSKAIPDDEPLGKEQAEYMTKRLTVIQVLLIAEAVVFVIHTILRFLEQLD